MSRDHFSARVDAKIKGTIYQIAEDASLPVSRVVEDLLNRALLAVDRRATKRFQMLQWKPSMLSGRY